jgi:DNA-directed RNA polymerase subunit RPC12/RpoP
MKKDHKITGPDVNTCSACPLGPPAWHYKCRECEQEFEVPAPKGPSEERGHVCPRCKGKNIERVKTVKSEACPPGG